MQATLETARLVAVELRRQDWDRKGLSRVLHVVGSMQERPDICMSRVHADEWPRKKAELQASGAPYYFRMPGETQFTSANGANWAAGE